MSEHIDPAQGLSLVALSEQEPELMAARTHAAGCARCHALLEESTLMLQMFDLGAAPVPAIDPALKARIEHQVFGSAWGWSHVMVALLAAVSFLLIWKNGHPFDFPATPHGLSCAGLESAYALAPLVIGGALTRMGKVSLSPARFASYTMASALFGQVLLRGHCEAHDLSTHLFVSHFLVVLAAGLLGAGAAKLLLPAR